MDLQLDIFGDLAEESTAVRTRPTVSFAPTPDVATTPAARVAATPVAVAQPAAPARMTAAPAPVAGTASSVLERGTASAPGIVIAGHVHRIVARSSDRIAWLRARSQGVTATDAAKLSTPRSIATVARDKFALRGFTGNAFTDHGRAREPHIASWVHDHFSLSPSDALFHSVPDRRHLATPDCISDDGSVLAEIKTTSKPFERIPKSYLRQIWWQQYVLGAERTLFVWEQHDEFVPVGPPRHQWVERDEDEIAALVDRAEQLLELLRG